MFQSKGAELVAPMRARVRVKVILYVSVKGAELVALMRASVRVKVILYVSVKGCGVGRPNEGEC